ncbi:MAG: ribbon-helix-helix protein, CopG family [Pseudomonadota bacterium]|nr:ribbon-helix-helix protein, CopG family [Pseudomonadota bacterium]
MGVRLDEDVLDAIERLAEEDERSVSFLINRICKEYLRARKLIK